MRKIIDGASMLSALPWLRTNSLLDRELGINLTAFHSDMLDWRNNKWNDNPSRPASDWRQYLLFYHYTPATDSNQGKEWIIHRTIPTLEFLRFDGGIYTIGSDGNINLNNGTMFSGAKTIGYNPFNLISHSITSTKDGILIDNVQDALDAVSQRVSMMGGGIRNVMDIEKAEMNNNMQLCGTITTAIWSSPSIQEWASKFYMPWYPRRSAIFGSDHDIFRGDSLLVSGKGNLINNDSKTETSCSLIMGLENKVRCDKKHLDNEITYNLTNSILSGRHNETMNSVSDSIIGGYENSVGDVAPPPPSGFSITVAGGTASKPTAEENEIVTIAADGYYTSEVPYAEEEEQEEEDDETLGISGLLVAGGKNRVSNSGHSIVTGYRNTIMDGSDCSAIFGRGNKSSEGSAGSLVAGTGNLIAKASNSSVFGHRNILKNSNDSLVAGTKNRIEDSLHSAIFGSQNSLKNAMDSLVAGRGHNILAGDCITAFGSNHRVPENATVNNVAILGGSGLTPPASDFAVTDRLSINSQLLLLGNGTESPPAEADIMMVESLETIPAARGGTVAVPKVKWSNALTKEIERATEKDTDLQLQLDAHRGQGGPLVYHDFGKPTSQITLEEFLAYAVSDIWGVGGVFTYNNGAPSESTYVLNGRTYKASDIFNATWVHNIFDDHMLQLVNTPDTNPPIFEIIDIGQSIVRQATNSTLGVVKGSTADMKVSVDSAGEMSVNGLNTALNGVNTALNAKQDKLIAGTNINISGNTISATGTPIPPSALGVPIKAMLNTPPTGEYIPSKDTYYYLLNNSGSGDTFPIVNMNKIIGLTNADIGKVYTFTSNCYPNNVSYKIKFTVLNEHTYNGVDMDIVTVGSIPTPTRLMFAGFIGNQTTTPPRFILV